MHYIRLIIILISFAGWVKVWASDSQEHYDYLFVLPLQHNYYQPLDAQALGRGNGTDFAEDAGAVFGNPAKLFCRNTSELAISSACLSGGRSGLFVSTDRSAAYPSVISGVRHIKLLGSGPHNLGLGWRRAIDQSINFPDVLEPMLTSHVDIKLDQLAAAWSTSLGSGNFSLGASLTMTRFNILWNRANEMEYANGKGWAPGFSAGTSMYLEPEWTLTAGFRSKTQFSSLTTFGGDTNGGKLMLAGAMPQVAWFTVKYQLESDFLVMAGMEMTGWHLVSSGYLEQVDYHIGLCQDFPQKRLQLSLGSYSLRHPLEQYLRRNDTHLQDMYFITGGVGVTLWPIPVEIKMAGATSRPLSGRGLNQNIFMITVSYSKKIQIII